MKRYIDWILRNAKMYIFRDKFLLAAKQWFSDDGDNSLRLNYDLNEDSIVFDIGGYEGMFAEKIHDRYSSSIFIFEPVSKFYAQIIDKFADNPKVKVFNFGLSSKDEILEIALSDDASSIHINSQEKEKIELVNIIEFIQKNNIEQINLMKINIEGGEFDILPLLIEKGMVKKIDNLQIQFHTFISNAKEKREYIREQLVKTHELTYDYYFIWENWKLKR